MCTYDEAIKIVNEAFDDQIIEVIDRIDRRAVNESINDFELRSILAFLLDVNYYRRTYGETPPDSDMTNFIVTRFIHSLPSQEIIQINTQRGRIQVQLHDAEFAANKAMEDLFTAFITQIGIPFVPSVAELRTAFQQEYVNPDTIIDLLVDFGARLPAPALIYNLGLFLRGIQRIHETLHIELQRILDQHIAIADEGEDDFSEAEEMSFEDDNELFVNSTGIQDSLEIGFNGAFFYNEDASI